MTSSNRPPPAPGSLPLAGLISVYLAVLLLVLVSCSFLGSTDLTPSVVWRSWSGEGGGEAFDHWLLLRARRVVYVALVGAALALAGTVFQAVLRNPLAEPYILGVSSGASVGAVVSLWILGLAGATGAAGVNTGALAVTLAAFGGALFSVATLLALVSWGRLTDPASLILCGVVLNAIFGAVILFFYSLAPPSLVFGGLHWLMGNLEPESFLGTPHVRNALFALIAGGILFAAVARHLDLLSLGDEEAIDLGLPAQRFRLVALVAASLLTAAIVAAAGPIGFIGLVVPHILRRLHGPSHRRLVPLSLVGGAIFLVLADALARTLVPRQPLPVGVITALVGGPFFLFLLVRQRGREAAEARAS